ncbi:MAG: YqgE/AlgH family protein [Gammaproteobacteria bacterium]
MIETISLKNSFLIAMPTMNNYASFHQAVVYIYEHTEQGTLGVVINKPLNTLVIELLRHLKIQVKDKSIKEQVVLFGGPVAQDLGLIIYSTDDQNIVISPAKEMLYALAAGRAPRNTVIALGYAGWARGQLEGEIQRNCWLVAPPNFEIMFDLPLEMRWQAAAASIGIDLNRVAYGIGHA